MWWRDWPFFNLPLFNPLICLTWVCQATFNDHWHNGIDRIVENLSRESKLLHDALILFRMLDVSSSVLYYCAQSNYLKIAWCDAQFRHYTVRISVNVSKPPMLFQKNHVSYARIARWYSEQDNYHRIWRKLIHAGHGVWIESGWFFSWSQRRFNVRHSGSCNFTVWFIIEFDSNACWLVDREYEIHIWLRS